MTKIKFYFLPVVFSLLRIWLGVQWLKAGWHKFAYSAFEASGFISGAIQYAELNPSFLRNLYIVFLDQVALPHVHVINVLVPWGEMFVGIGLIAGAFTLPALLGGTFMNLNFWLAGTTDANPLFICVALLLLVFIKDSVYFSSDRYLLPSIYHNLQERHRRRSIGEIETL